MRQIAYYVSLRGKLPRKRKVERFETRVESLDVEKAKMAALELIAAHKIRDPYLVYVQPWGVSETKFVDGDGEEQTLVMREIFPSGAGIEVTL